MEKDILLNIIKNQAPSVDTIGMILSNNTDFACEQGALISVKKFNDVSNDVIDYFNAFYGDRLRIAEGTEGNEQQFQPNGADKPACRLNLLSVGVEN